MAKSVDRLDKNKENIYDDGSYVIKKSRKHSVFAFTVCLLVAFAIWLYATNKERDQRLEELPNESAEAQTQSAELIATFETALV